MQIPAISYYKAQPFCGAKSTRVSSRRDEYRPKTNEEVLAAAKEKMAKRAPSFTPKQKAIFPDIELFKQSGIMEEMQRQLDVIDSVEKEFKSTGEDVIEKGDKRYIRIQEPIKILDEEKGKTITLNNAYMVKMNVEDADGELLYTYKKEVYGGHSSHALKKQDDEYGMVRLERKGDYGKQSIYVNNLKNEDYSFAGDISEDGILEVDYIANFA